MAQIASIRLFPDPILRRKCRPVTSFDKGLEELIALMDRTLRAQRHGIGIAAPQIGVDLAVAIVDVSSRIEDVSRKVVINPEILAAGPEIRSREGCMSLPDYTADLKRREWVRVRWRDEKGHWHEQKLTGIEGICFQHEIDHLKGTLFLDRVTCLKTDMYPRKGARPL